MDRNHFKLSRQKCNIINSDLIEYLIINNAWQYLTNHARWRQDGNIFTKDLYLVVGDDM